MNQTDVHMNINVHPRNVLSTLNNDVHERVIVAERILRLENVQRRVLSSRLFDRQIHRAASVRWQFTSGRNDYYYDYYYYTRNRKCANGELEHSKNLKPPIHLCGSQMNVWKFRS